MNLRLRDPYKIAQVNIWMACNVRGKVAGKSLLLIRWIFLVGNRLAGSDLVILEGQFENRPLLSKRVKTETVQQALSNLSMVLKICSNKGARIIWVVTLNMV